jgi:hypothetical protein
MAEDIAKQDAKEELIFEGVKELILEDVKEDPGTWWTCPGCGFNVGFSDNCRRWRKSTHRAKCEKFKSLPAAPEPKKAEKPPPKSRSRNRNPAAAKASSKRKPDRKKLVEFMAAEKSTPESSTGQSVSKVAEKPTPRNTRRKPSSEDMVGQKNQPDKKRCVKSVGKADKSMKRSRPKPVRKDAKNPVKKKKQDSSSARQSDYSSRAKMLRAVWNGAKVRTLGRLKKEDLMLNRRGRVVSKRASAHSSQLCRKNGWASHWATWIRSVQAARKEQGVSGFVKLKKNGNSKESSLHRRSVELWRTVKARANETKSLTTAFLDQAPAPNIVTIDD